MLLSPPSSANTRVPSGVTAMPLVAGSFAPLDSTSTEVGYIIRGGRNSVKARRPAHDIYLRAIRRHRHGHRIRHSNRVHHRVGTGIDHKDVARGIPEIRRYIVARNVHV